MATQSPISTISYNTESFLREKLENWVKSHLIQSFQYIKHKGEDGDKDHIHLRIVPNKRLDPMDLTDSLKEFDPKKPDKPLCVRDWKPSKEEDWTLYAVHDKEYLELKYGKEYATGECKHEKIPYEWTEIVVPENYDMEITFIRAKASIKHNPQNVAARMQGGENPFNLVLQGENVYLVNALMQNMRTNDYGRLQNECNKLYAKIASLEGAIDRLGYFPLYDDDDKCVLWPKGQEKIEGTHY